MMENFLGLCLIDLKFGMLVLPRYERNACITLAPKKLIRTRRASEGSASEPSLARRVSMC